MARTDLSFEALVEVTGATISAERGSLNAALKQIRDAMPEVEDADLADEIRYRAGTYRKTWPEMALTPTALSKHWARIPMEAAKPVATTNTHGLVTRCETCGGDRLVLVSKRNPKQSDWMRERGIEPNLRSAYEEYAPCPSCNSDADADFWREDGHRVRVPDPARVREMMRG